MKIALVSVCPDERQRRFLDIAWSGWAEYAKRHGLPIQVVEDPPVPEHVFWGRFFLLEMPEFRAFDAILHLDNDIFVNPEAPSIVEQWTPEKFASVDERAQWRWDARQVRDYYDYYDLPLSAEECETALVLNGGVFLMHRGHLPFFRDLYARWKSHVAALTVSRTKANHLKFVADQPHVSLAVQRAGISQPLDMRFNRLWWSWSTRGGERSEWPMKIYAKSVQLLGRVLPRRMLRPFARFGADQWKRILTDNYFVHAAGSKSPVALHDFDQGPRREPQ